MKTLNRNIYRPSGKGGGGQSSRPRGWGGLKKIFQPFRPQFGLKLRGLGLPGPKPGYASGEHLKHPYC